VAYWCKVKLDLSAMYDKAEAEAGAKPVPSSGGEVTKAVALSGRRPWTPSTEPCTTTSTT
jgi:hypothetical protein